MIDFQQVDKFYGKQDILADASFRIHAGERVGIIGPNGAGKSTIFSLIVGDSTPDKGQVSLPRNLRLGYLHQHVQIQNPDSPLLAYVESGMPEIHAAHEQILAIEHELHAGTAADPARALKTLGDLQTQFEALGGYEVTAVAKGALGGLGFAEAAFTTPMRTFSGGWQMRAELARIVVRNPDLLLLDEPSNYLDIPAIEWLQRFLRDYKGTLLMISHDRYLLNTLTTVTLDVGGGRALRYEGNYDTCIRQRQQRIEQETAAYKNQQRKREQLERFIERFKAKNTLATQAQSRVKQLARMEEITITRVPVTTGRIHLRPPPHSGQEIIRLENTGVTYDGDRWILRGLDLRIEKGEKVALVGHNGLGKTTLLRILAGVLTPSEGRRILGHKVLPGYQAQDFTETMDPQYTVYATVKTTAGDMTEQEIRTLLGGFGFSGQAVEKPVAVLSGGEKVRLAFARLLANPPNLLLLDEPTTHLDIMACEALENALAEYEGTICMVSHDIAFVRRIATHVIAMTPPGVTRYPGGYDYYREKTAPIEAAAAGAKPPSEKKLQRQERARQVQETARNRNAVKRRLTKAEECVTTLETEQKGLLAQLTDNSGTVDYQQINKRLQSLQTEIDTATREWEAAATEWEAMEAERGGSA